MNELIYHYTDINALKSILLNNKLWMTSHEFLNDTEEFIDGFNLLKRSVDKSLKNNNLSKKAILTIEQLMDYLTNTIILSSSFSKNGDLLSQWRSYCPIEGGFSIGFDKNIFNHGTRKGHEVSLKLYDCIYDESEKRRLAILFGETTIQQLDERSRFDKTLQSTFHDLFMHYIMLIISSKNIHFKEEEEIKYATYIHRELIDVDIKNMDMGNILRDWNEPFKIYDKKELSFRTKSNLLIPYLEQPFDILGIKEIIIGPTSNYEMSKKSLEFFLKNLNLNIEIKKSSVPYRNL